jgi:hypothetical protein
LGKKKRAGGGGENYLGGEKEARGGEGENYVGLSASTKVDADSLNFLKKQIYYDY